MRLYDVFLVSRVRRLYDQYSFQVIPMMGHLIAKDWNSYQYLVESIRRFPDQVSLTHQVDDCGLIHSVTELWPFVLGGVFGLDRRGRIQERHVC